MPQSELPLKESDEQDNAQARPHARVEGLVVRELADEVLVYDLERHKAVCLNRTAALVWRGCDGRADVASLARALRAELPAAAATEDVVWLALEQLGRENLLRRRVKRNASSSPTSTPKAARAARGVGMSRRELMRTLGVAAAVALPLVTAIVAPTASQAASCLPTGSPCTTAAQCCAVGGGLGPGLCVAGVCA